MDSLSIESLRAELIELMMALAEYPGSAAESAHLDRLLREQPAARKIYLEHIELLGSLHWDGSTASSIAGAFVPGPSTADGSDPRAAAKSPILGFLGAALTHVPGGGFALGGLLLAAVIGGFWGWRTFVFRPAAGPVEVRLAQPPASAPAPSAGVRSAGDVGPQEMLARLTPRGECSWGAESRPALVATARRFSVPPGQSLDLESGTAEIAFESGPLVTIEGPALVTLTSGVRCELRLGRLYVKVPHDAIGFTIDTPLAEIVDLGTEFGVEVRKDGRANVQVVIGQVTVNSAVDIDHGQGRIVGAGEAVRVSGSGAIEAIVPNAADFTPFGNAPSADISHSQAREFPMAIWLGNLFDDPRGAALEEALRTDTFRAVAETGDLGVDSAFNGGAAVRPIGGKLRFDFTNLGWTGDGPGSAVNDSWTTLAQDARAGGIRTQGVAEESDDSAKVEEGIGMHANAVLTFDLDQIRAAGGLQGKRLLFRVDRAGVNRKFGRLSDSTAGSVHMAAIASDGAKVLVALLDGQPADCAEHGGVARIASAVGEPLRWGGKHTDFRMAVPADAKYLTLAVVSAGDVNSDHGVWSGARLETASE